MFEQEAEVPRKLRALWALHVVGGSDEPFLLAQLNHPSEYIRGWAIRLLCEDNDPSGAARKEFARLATSDPSAWVRLALASALQRMPENERWPIAIALAAHAGDASDHSLPLMIWYGIEPSVGADPETGLKFALDCKLAKVRRFVARRVLSERTATNDSTRTDLVVRYIAHAVDPAVQLDLLSGMHDALRGRRAEHLPAGWSDLYARLSKNPSGEVQSEANSLALIFGDVKARELMQQLVADRSQEIDRRRRALDALIEAQAPGMAEILQRLLDDPTLRSRAIQGLAAYDDANTPKILLAAYGSLSLDEKHDALGTLISRPAYAVALLQAVEDKKIPAADLSATNARQLRQFKNKQVDELLAKTWGTIRETSADKKEQMARYKAQLSPEFIARGDASAGRALFAKTCGQCHTIYGAGGKIGPDLTGANRGSVDYVLQKLIDPSSAVPQDYQMQLVWLTDGRLVSGIIRERTPRAIVLQTETQQITIPTDDIDSQKPAGISMMPERQLDKLSADQIRDLFRFLATKTPPE